MTEDTGSIVTVTGRIDPEDLGLTSTHEHLFIDMSQAWFTDPESSYERKLARQPVSLENLWFVKQNPMKNEDNLVLDSMDHALDGMNEFGGAGGTSIVEVTPKNTGGDPERVRAVSRRTGVQVVQGTAYYTRPGHPASLDEKSVEELTEEFADDVVSGVGDTDVRAGIIGEIGVSGTIHEQEEKVLRASARAALRTGASVTVHNPGGKPGLDVDNEIDGSRARSTWAHETLDVLEDEGLPPERTIMDHMDGTLFEDLDQQRALADRGTHLEYDMWGSDFYMQQFEDGVPGDGWRLDSVATLVEEGYASNLVFGQDVSFKVRSTWWGGFGYAHIPRNVVPMLRSRGVSNDAIDQILVDNPARILTFDEPST